MSGSGGHTAMRSARTVVVVTAVAVGLGLAAAATAPARRRVAAADLSTRVTAALAGAAVAGAIAVVLVRLVRTGRPSTTERSRNAIVAAVVCAASIGALGAVGWTNAGEGPAPAAAADDQPASAEGQTPAAGDERPAPSTVDRQVVFDIDTEGTVILLIALGMLGAALVFFSRRTGTRVDERAGVYVQSTLRLVEPEIEPDDDDLADALRSSLAALATSGSSRDQIRAAYGALLEHLGLVGLGRRPSETPGAYIGRCLRSDRVPGEPALILLHLFEVARFSDAELGADDVDAARTALQQAIRHLDGVTA